MAQKRYYARRCCGHHKHDTIGEALSCTNIEFPHACVPSYMKHHSYEELEVRMGDSPCIAHAVWGKCEGVDALVWAFGDFTWTDLTPEENCKRTQMTNPEWWDKHRPGWRRSTS